MDIITIKFLFSVAFILIGSLAFHISALISGHNIYRDLSIQESTLLSIVVGIVIFLLSPISYIIIPNSDVDFTYANMLVDIMNFKVLFSFFGAAFGFGLIFGGCIITQLRLNVLRWLRDNFKLNFWIYFYGNVWDDFLSCVQRESEVTVQTDDAIFKGLLVESSIREEPRQIVLSGCKIIEGDINLKNTIKGKEDVKVLILGSKIKKIIVPESSFHKHFDSMEHISQATYCIIMTIGLLFLSFSAHLTGNYLSNLESLGASEVNALEAFYYSSSIIFSVLALIILCISIWVAKKDYGNFKSFLLLSPYIAYVAIILSLILIVYILLIIQILQLIQILLILGLLYIIFILYIVIKFNKARKYMDECFCKIIDEFGNDQLLEIIIKNCCLQISRNKKGRAHIKDIEIEILKKCDYDPELSNLIVTLDNNFDILKKKWDYLKEDDYNLLLAFEKYIIHCKNKDKVST